MMTFNSSKMAIHLVAKQGLYNNDDGLAQTNYLITCCILYELISSLVKNNPGYDGQISNLASRYLSSYISIVEGLKKKYVSYSVRRSTIRKWGYPKFYDLTENQAEQIISLYHDKTEMEQFSLVRYSQQMYNVENISNTYDERLKKVHYKIMIPIVSYCMDKYGIKTKDVEVYSIDGVESNPGKEIVFKINGIPVSKLISDIMNRSGIQKYIYSAIQYGDYVKIIIK